MSAIGGIKKFNLPELATTKNSQPTKLNDAEDAKLREVADMYEQFFIKELMRHMKSGLNEDGGMIKKNNAEKIFSEQLDEQYSKQWNQRGGFGLSELIYQNVSERYKDQFTSSVDKVADVKIEKPADFSHEQMLWQVEQQTKAFKK